MNEKKIFRRVNILSKLVELQLDIKVADRFFTRFKGLMFRKEPIRKEGLLITECNSIHMFFMKFAIDVVMLSKDGKVVKTISNLQPWKLVGPVKKAYSTLELPVGTIEKNEIRMGDRISLLNNKTAE